MSRNIQEHETITLGEAKSVITSLAGKESVLLLSPPGLGKSAVVAQAAAEAGLELRSLLGTQIAPEDVSGIPRIVGERSVFCPPRVLLPEEPKPFCLFLDELPACAPDIQKAFYSLLLERRLGEHALPEGTWVVAAGNRVSDRALVRAMSSALVNRVFILNLRLDVKEWLQWGANSGIRKDILSFISFSPSSLMREVPAESLPFSTPRAWSSLSAALDLAEESGILNKAILRSLVFGRVSAQDAALFCTLFEEDQWQLETPADYIAGIAKMPESSDARWLVLSKIREAIQAKAVICGPADVNTFLSNLPLEQRSALLIGLLKEWGGMGANASILNTFIEYAGIQ